MKTKIAYVEYNGKQYPMCFNINVMDEIQQKYGTIGAWGDAVSNGAEASIKDLKIGLELMMNEAIDILNETADEKMDFVDTKKVGRIITEAGTESIQQAILSMVKQSTDSGAEKNE